VEDPGAEGVFKTGSGATACVNPGKQPTFYSMHLRAGGNRPNYNPGMPLAASIKACPYRWLAAKCSRTITIGAFPTPPTAGRRRAVTTPSRPTPAALSPCPEPPAPAPPSTSGSTASSAGTTATDAPSFGQAAPSGISGAVLLTAPMPTFGATRPPLRRPPTAARPSGPPTNSGMPTTAAICAIYPMSGGATLR